jgi:hypothetical protein
MYCCPNAKTGFDSVLKNTFWKEDGWRGGGVEEWRGG